MNVNSITFAGNLTRDPELRKTQSGTDICKFGMACNEYAGKGKDKRTTFIDCTAFGVTAVSIDKFFKKGSAMLFFGRIDYSSWTTDSGDKRNKISFVVNEFHFVGDAKDDDSGERKTKSKSKRISVEDIPF